MAPPSEWRERATAREWTLKLGLILVGVGGAHLLDRLGVRGAWGFIFALGLVVPYISRRFMRQELGLDQARMVRALGVAGLIVLAAKNLPAP